MKFRLFRRRLTISSPRMAVRSAMPWPLRWALAAVMLGASAAIALWTFEMGVSIAGLDRAAKLELTKLREEVAKLHAERDKSQSIANISGSLLTAEKAAQEKMLGQIRQLESENRLLRDDLGFFEKLLPAGSADNAAIRGLQAEKLSDMQVKWQVLVIQPVRDAPVFNGKLELTFSGTLAGKPWTTGLAGGAQALQFKQYRRVEGVLDVPAQAVVQTITAKLIEGTVTRSVQVIKL
ncbi:MAG: hypothetical protein M3Q12_09660 [Pseudomonadota bacterium]|uniref:DUF6776 family protein n=1 Tax=Polaromonas sp. TaxID=1869339 RepID=UPI0018506CA4|nr:DUF6776 family protein [Polaromonas sp.]MBA3595450.1 hypothetical protein [Polaromonas sp.]MDQ3272414.1 hypothetical protein [Pseudomonadota bacterium]